MNTFRRAAEVHLPGGRGSCRASAKLGRSLALPHEAKLGRSLALLHEGSAGRFQSAARLRTKSEPRNKHRRAGLSLLEVVLALSILAVAAGLLAQITKQATDNGLLAQRLATAQMLCESKMSEVLAGAIPLTTSSWTQITDSGKGNFYYQIRTESAQRPNMIGVRLSVTDQPDSSTSNPELFFIVRWMIDPSLGLDTPPTATESTGSSTSGSTGSAGGVQ